MPFVCELEEAPGVDVDSSEETGGCVGGTSAGAGGSDVVGGESRRAVFHAEDVLENWRGFNALLSEALSIRGPATAVEVSGSRSRR